MGDGAKTVLKAPGPAQRKKTQPHWSLNVMDTSVQKGSN